ncbi:MAG: M16 family metallopeptidase [Cypionkella sp.]
MKVPSRFRALAALPLMALALAGCASLPAADAPARTIAAPAALPAPTGTTGWGFPIYDIPADPAVRFGVLPNGLKYAVLANATPKNTVAVRLGFDVGYIDESDAEAGLAHFLEHMAFNGSKNVPEGEMIKLLEREGLSFGADTNASTGFEETIYKLDLPRNEPKLLDTALMLMRETGSNLTLDPAAIDRERGVIQSETRTRNTFMRRRIKHYFDFIAPGTVFSRRLFPANTEANIDSFTRDTLEGLYRRFYRPDNATLVIVGDVEPDAVEAAIKARFADWQAPANPTPRVDKGQVDLQRGPAAANFVDPAVPVLVTIDRFAPYAAKPETVAEFRRVVLNRLGIGVLNRRLEKIANAADAPILSGSASTDDLFDIARQSSITIQAKEGPDSWKTALALGTTEMRRLAEHGVTAAELREQLANLGTAYRTAAEQEKTRRNPALAEAILGTVPQQDVFITPSTRYALFQQLSQEITPEAVHAAVRTALAGSEPLIHVSTKTPVEGGEAAILAAYRAAAATPVAPPAQAADAAFGYTDFGAPGTIAADSTIADLGIRQIRFANNVRLNLKQTDFEQGRLRFLVRLGSGMLAIPKEDAAVGVFTGALFGTAGTGKHGFDELQQILAGRQLSYGLVAGDDAFQVSGVTTMADFATQMQLSAAYVSDPGYRGEALARWRGLIPPFLAQTRATPAAVAQFQVPRIVANGDPRFGLPDREALEAVTLEEVREDLSGQLATAPIEISVVGAFDEAAVIEAVAASFGALPPREPALDAFAAARQVRFAADTRPVTLTHTGPADQALVQSYWPTRDDSDAQEDATLSLLAEVLQLELLEEVREKLGATYSPSAGSSTSATYPGFGTLSTSIVVRPQDADSVFAAVDRIAAQLRNAPPAADTIERARKPVLERAALNRRENSWWLQALRESQLRPERLERFRTVEARYRAVTPAMLQAAARKYLDPKRRLDVRIVPESAGAK